MKKNIITILFLFVVISSCTSNLNQLNGNYYYCNDNNEYVEIYSKKDSFKLASSLRYTSDWIHYKIEFDTIYFVTPSEWRDSTKASIQYSNGKITSMNFFEIKTKFKLFDLNKKFNPNLSKDDFLKSVFDRSNYSKCKD